jgi:O-glycosyl hydrolase
VIADETSRIRDQLLRTAPVWAWLGGAGGSVAAIAHHWYDFPADLALRAARLEAAALGRPLWMTEICCFDSDRPDQGHGRQYDPTMSGAMPLANLVWRSLTLAGDAAFHWWVALSSEIGADPVADPLAATRPNRHGWNDGLVYYDARHAENGNHRLYLTKRYWALANFSRYVKPGDVRHPVRDLPDGVRALAFRSARGWTVVLIANTPPGGAPVDVRVQLPVEAGSHLALAETVETSAERDLEPVTGARLDAAGRLSMSLPPQSVTTAVISAGGEPAGSGPQRAEPAGPS